VSSGVVSDISTARFQYDFFQQKPPKNQDASSMTMLKNIMPNADNARIGFISNLPQISLTHGGVKKQKYILAG